MGFKATRAERHKIKLKLAISAPSGGGKTYSALLLAKGLADGDMAGVYLLDTENESSESYADLGAWNHVPFEPPFSPDRYGEAIQYMVDEGAKVIILDSITHEWEWCLDYNTKLGGKYQDWAKTTPQHKKFVDSMLQAPVHVISTIRRKTDYSMEQVGGRVKIQKVGLKQVQREGMDYEFFVLWALNQSHLAMAEKDRTGLFMDRAEEIITEQTGLELLGWVNGAKNPTYTGSGIQKLTLHKWLKEFDVQDIERMRQLNDHLKENHVEFTKDAIRDLVNEFHSPETDRADGTGQHSS